MAISMAGRTCKHVRRCLDAILGGQADTKTRILIVAGGHQFNHREGCRALGDFSKGALSTLKPTSDASNALPARCSVLIFCSLCFLAAGQQKWPASNFLTDLGDGSVPRTERLTRAEH